ncbi:MAG: apolipoprotein N-acyltransferase [Verrucomicrobiales bacterium]|nr:apolipoprotein N-acyltransferase [Verrucomicrobiales bacterium]
MTLPHRFVILRWMLAAVAGAVWACAFPSPGIAGLAWVAPGILLWATHTPGPDRGLCFRLGYVAGATHYLLSLSWLRHIPFPAGAYAGWFALSFFLALLPAAWVLMCWSFARRLGVAGAGADATSGLRGGNSLALPGQGLGETMAGSRWVTLNLWFLLCAVSWVALEMLVARLFGGFPWNLLGTSQHRMTPVIQIASATGVYGVSFLVVWFSTSLMTALVLLVRHPDRPGLWRRPLVFPALIVVAVTGGGTLGMVGDAPPARRLNVALVQPSIAQTMIFDADAGPQRFETLLRLTEQAVTTRPDLVLWPEASLPGGLSREQFERLVDVVKRAGVWMIFGADEPDEGDPATGVGPRSYNSAFLLNPQGEVVNSYRKQRLVMFGEYIPFGRWLPFLQRLAPIGDGFHPGPGPVTFGLPSLDVRTSVLICFEDNFPHQARQHVGPDTDFLVNITNDAWFGESAAQWQHHANASLRAVENGLPLVRCSNNGISGWIDRRGRMHSARISGNRDAYAAGFEVVSVPLGLPQLTFYHRFGDVFGWACVAAALLALGWQARRAH